MTQLPHLQNGDNKCLPNMFVVKTKLDIIYDTLNHSFWLIEAHLIEQILIAGLRNTRGFPGSTGGKERDCQCRRETLF